MSIRIPGAEIQTSIEVFIDSIFSITLNSKFNSLFCSPILALLVHKKMESNDKQTPQPYLLRFHRAEDMQTINVKHGQLYKEAYGWNEQFEQLVTQITDDFIRNYDRILERCWIAEHENGSFLGCVMVVKDTTRPKTAKLRLLLVDPAARGLGLGRTLVQQCTEFARQAGYVCITLWTHSGLTSALKIYTAEGYKLVREENSYAFGVNFTGQHWELEL